MYYNYQDEADAASGDADGDQQQQEEENGGGAGVVVSLQDRRTTLQQVLVTGREEHQSTDNCVLCVWVQMCIWVWNDTVSL